MPEKNSGADVTGFRHLISHILHPIRHPELIISTTGVLVLASG